MTGARGQDADRAIQRSEDDSFESGVIMPGGKVDPDAIRAATGAGDGDDDGLRRVVFRLQRDLNKRLDKYLTDRITFMSRNQLQRLIDVGGVTVNDRAPKASTKLRLGDVVEVVVPPPPATEIQGEDIPLDVLFEDDAMIVLNKRTGIIVHPARSHNRGTMLNALVHHFAHRSDRGGGLSGVGRELARPGVVHRLDRDTTGVIVFAKDDEAHWKLGRQFELRKVDKRYLALTRGVIEADAEVMEEPIGPSPSRVKGQREKMVVRRDELGKPAVTIARVRQRFRGFTLVEIELKTGRTHQIRVHLSHAGYPILGDDMYGGPASVIARSIHPTLGDEAVITRQALHAASLSITHPRTNETMTFTAPLPDEMRRAVALLRAHAAPGPVLNIPGSGVDLEKALPD